MEEGNKKRVRKISTGKEKEPGGKKRKKKTIVKKQLRKRSKMYR